MTTDSAAVVGDLMAKPGDAKQVLPASTSSSRVSVPLTVVGGVEYSPSADEATHA
jgi:hypothetical protein